LNFKWSLLYTAIRVKKIAAYFLGILSLILLLSFAFLKLGDRLFAQDSFPFAKYAYRVAYLLNPFNLGLEKRIQASDVLNTERSEESEETAVDKNIAYKGVSKINVLGASTTVPVLMYHYIRVNPNQDDKVGFRLSVSPQNFAAQMNYLAQQGYHTISLDDLGGFFFSHASLPSKPIIFTFDDGYSDFYTAAYPILKSHGFKAVSFVITGFVGIPGFLTWSQIDEMKSSGLVFFGSHTVHHLSLPSIAFDKIQSELTQSKKELEQHLGYPINWMAYPYGSVNKAVVDTALQSGYVGAFGTNRGTYQSTDFIYTLPRIRIGGGDTLGSFSAKIP